MIKFNNSDIIDWNFDNSNIIKVYHNGAIVFYKFDSEQGGYKVCFAVVADITQYQETEFEDVYETSSDKWYKLNNLNQYEQYGVYGSGRNITTYNGKLTIDDGYEYEWNGSSWVNVGEVSGSSRVPDGYTEVEYIENTGTSYINTGVYLYDTTTTSYEIETKISSSWHNSEFEYLIATEGTSSPYNGVELRWNTHYQSGNELQCESVPKNAVYSNIDNGDGTSAVTITCSATQATNNVPLSLFCGIWTSGPWRNGKGKFYSFKITKNNTLVGDLVPAKRDSDDKYGMYDLVTNAFYLSPNNVNFSGGAETGTTEYPKYYSEKSEPLDDLTFNTLAEAQAYAEANCVYDGMHATIDGDRYYFDSTDENGWVKILEYYKVEDVTPGGASGWTITGSSTYNPQPSYYDDFSVALNNGYQTKVAKVTIYGYDHFTYYLRSTGYSSYAYATSSNVDELASDPTSMSYSSSSAITNTYNFNKAAGSAVNLSNYRRVTYNNLDKTVEHTFYVVFYNGYYTSSYPPSATLLIPKEQTNENWEQVTFSASSNVASAQKSLYIDGNTSTSGGTSSFCYRWMIGLPSGSHSSYINYNHYGYCPNVTSSTFTSVAGEQRQVNFTYDSVSNKSLQFRLVDTSGNTLSPSDTVYYNYTGYNSCNISSTASNVSMPRSMNVKVGGRFRFANSSNRHYIYGYSPNISFNTDYYVDNYQSTFDITYTKLSEEAVTVTYATYDPSDTETPAFNTDITYPYSGGTTSSTTLTSFDVPYTYPYEVSQTSDKFSAASQSYTAVQSSRTINFVLYPNNREFTTVADMEAYAYAWEGMKASANGTKYQYKNGEWVEQAYTQYEYIRTQNNSNKYYKFNTGFYPTTANTIEIKMEMVDTSVDWGAILGWASCDGDSCDSTQFRFTTVTNGYAIIGRKGNTSGIKYYNIGANKPIVVKLPISASTYTYNSGTTDVTCNFNVGTMNLPSSIPLHLCSIGYAKKAAVMKVYYVKVYDSNENLVKHYVPSDNNGTPCFYEIVDGEYIMDTYTGSNHGTLTLGPEVQ